MKGKVMAKEDSTLDLEEKDEEKVEVKEEVKEADLREIPASGTSSTEMFGNPFQTQRHPLSDPIATIAEGNHSTAVHGFVTICKGCGRQIEHRLARADRVPGRCVTCGAPLRVVAEVP